MSLRPVALSATITVIVGASLGCGGNVIEVNGIEVYERQWNLTVSQLHARAAYEMQCPAEQLKFELLRRDARYPVEVAVNGCGRRALYARTIQTGYGPGTGAASGWLLSSANWSPATPVAAAPPPAPAPPSAPPPKPAPAPPPSEPPPTEPEPAPPKAVPMQPIEI